MKNMIKVKLTIEESFINIVKKTPALNQLFTKTQLSEIKVGENVFSINHFIFSKLNNISEFNLTKIN